MPVTPFADSPQPNGDPIASQPRKQLVDAGETDTLAGLVSSPWSQWFDLLSGQVQASPFVQNSVTLTAQGASIPATDFTGGALQDGFYDLRYYVRVTRAATTSSSIQVTIGWTDGGVTLSFPGTIHNANLVTDGGSQGLPLVHIDGGSPVTFSTTYASVGGTSMQYSVAVAIIQVPT